MDYKDPTVNDRRLFERFPSRFPAKIKDTKNNFGETILLRNASITGVMLTSKQRMYINDKIVLEIELPGRSDPMTFKGNVIWAKDIFNGEWEVGVRNLKIDFMQSSRLYKRAAANFAM